MEFIKSKLTTYLVLSVVCTAVTTNTFVDHKRLYDGLRKNTDTRIRPIFNQTNVLNVTVMPKLLKIQALVDHMQMLYCTIVLEFKWVSELLRWNPSIYGGIDYIHLPSQDAWLPDIVYQNTINNLFDMKTGGKMKITVAADGSSKWKAGSNIMSHCRVEMQNYPFDSQTCYIIIGKIYSSDQEMMIVPTSDTLSLEEYEENDEWILVDTKVSYLEIDEQFHFVQFEVTIKRRPLYYLFNIVFPIILLSLMNVFSFKIPSSSGERISYCVSMLLTFCVFLSIVSEYLPRGSATVSYLQLYISIQLGFCIMTTIASVQNLNFSEYGNRVPGWLNTLYFWSCRKTHKKTRVEPSPSVHNIAGNDIFAEHLEYSGQEENINKKTAVRFIDNLCFWLFMLLFLFSTVILFSVMILF